MPVVVFRHGPQEVLGSLSVAFERRHIPCRVVDLGARPADLPSLSGTQGLVLMGGSMSANDDLPGLRHEMQMIRVAVERGLPVLGICLGAQLVARALGARVYTNPAREIGWRQIRFTAAASADHLFHGLSGAPMVFKWHAETFDLPPGAQLLAYSDHCRHEAFRVDDQIYGVQFHPEATPSIIADWLREDAARGSQREVKTPVDPAAHAAEVAQVAEVLFDRWCALIQSNW
jgi:GMP synthase-like glutamine amidotransferase